MAYGVLYEFRRTSTNGADMLITISKKGYDGAINKRALGRAPIIKRDNNGHIYGTSCELYAECLVDGEFSHLYTSDAYEYKVEVYKNNTLLWAGFVSPELYSEPDIAPPYDVQIIATDGLGELKNYNFQSRGVASILEHLDTLMTRTGLEMDFEAVSALKYINADGSASRESGILGVMIDLDHEEGNSYYEVLQNLLSSLNANITQLNGKYLIFRETDFISKAGSAGVEAFDFYGSKINLPVASFGSMKSNQWWPVGQFSTVIEPAKNHLTLQSPNHYKGNALNFDNWELSELASYSEADNAYILPGASSSITQTVDFAGHEVGYRLALAIRARNVGAAGDDPQNIGIKVEVDGRSYSVGRKFWLVKSANNSGRPINDYLFRSTEGYIEEDLPTPTEGATSSDAQDINIVLPLHTSGSRSYVYANNIKLTIFNPLGLYNIHVYDVSLVKYEQAKGYEANVIIENMARESEPDINLTITAGDLAPAAGNVFMTGLPLRPSDREIVTRWQIGLNQAQDYLSLMAFDYSRQVSLPRMKYSGILNVPGAAILPTLFLRDGTYYFPKTYSYDLYADEITVDLVSISAADVSLSSVKVVQISEATGTPGTTTGGSAGAVGGSLYLRDLLDVNIETATKDSVLYFDGNKWINKELSGLLSDSALNTQISKILDWFTLEDGVLLTKYNLASEKEVSAKGINASQGGGSSYNRLDSWSAYDSSKAGYVLSALLGYDLHSRVTNLENAEVDLSDYYTKSQTNSQIASAIGAIDLSPYATKEALSTLEGKHNTLRSEFDALSNLLSSDTDDYINTWNEVVAFLDGYKDESDLATILSGMNADISSRLLTSTFDSWKADTYTPLANLVANHTTKLDSIDASITNINTRLEGVDKTIEDHIAEFIAFRANFEISDNLILVRKNFASTEEVSAKGINQGTGGGGGSSYSRLDTWDGYDNNKAGYVLSAGLGYGLKVAIDELNGYDLDNRVRSIENSYVSKDAGGVVNGGLVVSSLAVAGGSSSQFLKADGSLDGTSYLPTRGGVITGDPALLTFRVPRIGADAWLQFTDTETSDIYAIGLRRPADMFGLQYKINDDYYDILHSGNIGEYAPAITANQWATSAAFIGEVGTAYIAYRGGSDWSVTDNGWSNEYPLIHSGNVGSYNAGGLVEEVVTDLNSASSNRIFTMTSGYGSTEGNKPTYWWVTGITLRIAQDDAYQIQIAASDDSSLYFRREHNRAWDAWKTIAFTDSNVASAQALMNQYGGIGATVDSSSHVHFHSNRIYWHGDSSNYYIAFPFDGVRSPHAEIAGYGGIKFLVSGVPAMLINSSGNVTIGYSDLAGTSARLYVDGAARFAEISDTSSIHHYDSGKGYFVGLRNSGLAGVTSGGLLLYSYGGTPMSFFTDGGERMHITASGNVGIGIDNPQYKLHVDGTGYFSGALTVSGTTKSERYLLSNSEDSYCGLMPNSAITLGGNTGDIWLFNNQAVMLYGGKGVIVTSSFDVRGAVSINSTLSVANTISSADSITTLGGHVSAYNGFLVNNQNKLSGLVPNSRISGGGNATDVWMYVEAGKAIILGESGIDLRAATTISSSLSVSGILTVGGASIHPTANNPYFQLYQNNNYWYWQADNSYTYIGGTMSKALRIDQDGNTLIRGSLGVDALLTASNGLAVSGLSTFTGGVVAYDIHGNGQSLYLGNASNNAFIKVREDMVGSSSMWSIPRDGKATFTSLTTPTLSVTGSATIASVTIDAGNATLSNLTVNTVATLKQLVVGIDGMSCNAPATFNDFIYGSSITPRTDNYYVLGNNNYKWYAVTAYNVNVHDAITIEAGKELRFKDDNGVVHTLKYDSTKQAFVFDGNVNATGEMSAKKLNA